MRLRKYLLLAAFFATLIPPGYSEDETPNPDPHHSSALVTSKQIAADPKKSEQEIVQNDILVLSSALYGANVDKVLEYTHPKIIQMMGGEDQSKIILTDALSKIQSAEIHLESMSFPESPTFLHTAENDFVIVPTKSIFLASGQRAESLNYQFGIRKAGTTEWKYIEGSRINPQNVKMLFPDFPADYDFPRTYRKKL